jgi:hypothetical protein
LDWQEDKMNQSKVKFGKRFLNNMTMVGLALCGVTLSAQAAPEVPFIVSAYNAVEKDPAKAAVSATITMTTLGTSSKGPKVLVAQGPLAMEGDLLGGRLPMTFDKMGNLPSGQHSLFFNISKTGRIGLQWLVNDKPRDGKSMQAFDTDIAGSTLTKKVTWQGEYRLITVEIQRKLNLLTKPILVPGGVKVQPTPKPTLKPGKIIKFKPTPTPKPMVIVTAPIKKKAVGRKLKVTGRLIVTNSDDGVGGIFGNSDKTVELAGGITFGNQSAFSFNNRSADDGAEFKSKAMNSVNAIYAQPDSYRFFAIKGHVWDVDKASARDTLWISSTNVNILEIMQSGKEYLIKGDRKSESADLYIRVTDEGEIF